VSLDPAWRQGLADVATGEAGNPFVGTNLDILEAIERNSPKRDAADPGESVESGDEASCPGHPDTSDAETSDDDDVDSRGLPEGAKYQELVDNNGKKQLARYTVHLEQEVLRLQKVRFVTASEHAGVAAHRAMVHTALDGFNDVRQPNLFALDFLVAFLVVFLVRLIN
jgi:hypothetical protein